MNHPFMTSLANFLCALNISTLRFNFPYIEKGRRAPESPKIAQQAIVDMVDFIANTGNTQPVIVCRFEAKSIDRMQEIQNEILDKLSEFGEISFENC